MKMKYVIGIFVIVIAAIFVTYMVSEDNKEINEWGKLVKSNSHLSELSDVSNQSKEPSEKLNKAFNQIEDMNKKEDTLKKINEAEKEFTAIKKKIESMKYEDTTDQKLTNYVRELKEQMLACLVIQEAKIVEYKKYAKEKDEVSMEKIYQLDSQLEVEIEGLKKVQDKIVKHYQK